MSKLPFLEAIIAALGEGARVVSPMMGGGISPDLEAQLVRPSENARDRSPRDGVAGQTARARAAL